MAEHRGARDGSSDLAGMDDDELRQAWARSDATLRQRATHSVRRSNHAMR